MTESRYTNREDAIKKIKTIAEDIKICMFCTHTNGITFETQPIGTRKVDNEGNIWFLTPNSFSKKIEEMSQDKVRLIYSKPTQAHFMSVLGHAEVIKDSIKAEELVSGLKDTLLPEERKSSGYSFIRITPEHADFWDELNGKMMSLL